MSHNQFILSYEKGTLGCVVGTPQAFRLFSSGQVDHSKVNRVLLLLAAVSLGFIGSCLALFGFAPMILAIIGSILVFGVCCLVITHGVAELVIEFAFVDGTFFGLAVDQRVLIVCDDEEEHQPTVEAEESLRNRRRAQR